MHVCIAFDSTDCCSLMTAPIYELICVSFVGQHWLRTTEVWTCCPNTARPIDMPFLGPTLMGQRNQVLNGGVEIPPPCELAIFGLSGH